jgi:hypothetical protein
MWCVVACDLETSKTRWPWPALGRSAKRKKKYTCGHDVTMKVINNGAPLHKSTNQPDTYSVRRKEKPVPDSATCQLEDRPYLAFRYTSTVSDIVQ